MRKILLIGAGRSSSYLIKYFLDHAPDEKWSLTVADVSEDAAMSRVGNHPAAKGVGFDINDEEQRRRLIGESDIVISMLPANMHYPVAVECLKHKKNLVTASYVSAEMHALNDEVSAAGLLFMNECGLDPGIDHMSAMEVIDGVHANGGNIHAFRSYTGGLVAPESNDNPWGYKFSWNPRNVILAGQGTAKYIENGNYKYIPYNRLFKEVHKISVDSHGDYDGYANRDSLSYRKLYNLENIPTMIRGTLRQSGYCSAWNVFVQLGLTDDTYIIEDSANLTYRKLVEAFVPNQVKGKTTEERLADFIGLALSSQEMQMVLWTGIVDDIKIGLPDATPAQILQQLLEQKWKLRETDKDLIVMQHIFEYSLKGKNIFHTTSLVVKGENSVYTAMAKTVGTPLAIVTKHILNDVIKLKGVRIPTDSSVYTPVLEELKEYGVSFIEKQKVLV